MIIYVLVGGMKGTTWVQIVKAALLIIGAGVMTVWVLAMFGFSLSDAAGRGGRQLHGRRRRSCSAPGLQYGKSTTTKIDFISLGLALVLGTAGLPHVLMRFYTVPSSKQARKSVEWAIWLIGIFYLFTLVLGFGAAALVGPAAIKAAPGKANSAAPLLAFELGGEILLGLISAVAFATILAVVAGPDDHGERQLRPRRLRPGHQAGQGQRRRRGQGRADHRAGHRHRRDHRRHLRQRPEHRLPRRPGLRHRRERQPADDPVLAVLERFNTRGALWSIYGGLISLRSR